MFEPTVNLIVSLSVHQNDVKCPVNLIVRVYVLNKLEARYETYIVILGFFLVAAVDDFVSYNYDCFCNKKCDLKSLLPV